MITDQKLSLASVNKQVALESSKCASVMVLSRECLMLLM